MMGRPRWLTQATFPDLVQDSQRLCDVVILLLKSSKARVRSAACIITSELAADGVLAAKLHGECSRSPMKLS